MTRIQLKTAFAVTLIELIVSLAIVTILMTGLASAVLIARHALPDREHPAGLGVPASHVLEELTDELRNAHWIVEAAPTAVTYTVPDRNGDGVPERIRYAWSGTPGDPLTRSYNGGAPAEILSDVREFSLSYERRSAREVYSGIPVQSAEGLLASYVAAGGLSEAQVTDDHWWAQCFQPTLPAGAVSWSVTRAIFVVKADGPANETTTVQLRPRRADGWPSSTIIDQATLLESSMGSSYATRTVSFASATGLSPTASLCLAFVTSGAPSCKLRYKSSGASVSGGALVEGHPGWDSIYTTQALLFGIYGTCTTLGPSRSAQRQYLTDVQAALRSGRDNSDRAVAATQLLNTPEVLSTFWESSFDVAPTALDLNGDGAKDWIVRGGGSFDAASLSGGVWRADATLDTYPADDFTKLTTVELRFRATSVGGYGACFWINADWGNGLCAPIFAFARLESDGSQTLTVYHKLDSSTWQELVKAANLSSDFVALRLLIDPDLDTVNVVVNGRELGTRAYNRVSPTDSQRNASILGWGASAEFDYVCVRVGGRSGGVGNLPPIANAGANLYWIKKGQSVKFDGSGSEDPDGDSLSHLWDFGDGSPGIVALKPTRTYGDRGTYGVTLTVSDGKGGTDQDTVTVHVADE